MHDPKTMKTKKNKTKTKTQKTTKRKGRPQKKGKLKNASTWKCPNVCNMSSRKKQRKRMVISRE